MLASSMRRWFVSSGLRPAALLLLSVLIVSFWAVRAFRNQGSSLFRALAPILGWVALWMMGYALLRRFSGMTLTSAVRKVAHASIASCLFLFFLPEYLLGNQVLQIRSVLLLLLSFGLFIVLLFELSRGDEAPSSFSEVKLGTPMTIMFVIFLLIYFGGSTYLSLRKLATLGYAGQDLAYFSQIFYTTLHGRIFNSNFYQDLLYAKTVQSDFAGHNSPIQYLFVAFYYLHPSPATLLVLRNAMITLCACPAYLLARSKFSPRQSAVLAIMFVLIPAVFFQNLFEFYPFSLAAFFLLFSFYFYEKGKFGIFIGSLGLTLLVREDLVFAIFFFSLFALWQKRGWRWRIIPAGLAVFWAILSWKFVLPHFLQGASFRSSVCFAHLGGNYSEILNNILHHSTRFIFTRDSVIYLKQLMTPYAGFVPWFSPFSIGSLPYLGINLLGGAGECPTVSIFSQHSIVPTVFLFVGFLYALEGFKTFSHRFGISARRSLFVITAFAFTLTLADLVFVTYPEQFEELEKRPVQDEARLVASLIPLDAAVAAPRYICPLLSNRMALYMTDVLLNYHHPDPEYVIIDRDWRRMRRTERWRPVYDRLLVALQADSNWAIIYDTNNYIIYKRRLQIGASLR